MAMPSSQEHGEDGFGGVSQISLVEPVRVVLVSINVAVKFPARRRAG